MKESLFEKRSIAVGMLEVRFWTRRGVGVAREAQVPCNAMLEVAWMEVMFICDSLSSRVYRKRIRSMLG